ncbi:MAG: NAD(P)H-dependent oxidoreductase [Acidimicrobiia bacterium]
MRVVAVVGNPNRGGRTSAVAEKVATRVASLGDGTVEVVELVDVASELFDWGSQAVNELTARVRSADAAVFASPTYKAGITGLLKAFLDRYGTNGLAGLVAVPVMLGGAATHVLAVETQLRPVLVELAAITPTKGLYVVDSELDGFDVALEEWWQLAGPPLQSLLRRAPVA